MANTESASYEASAVDASDLSPSADGAPPGGAAMTGGEGRSFSVVAVC